MVPVNCATVKVFMTVFTTKRGTTGVS